MSKFDPPDIPSPDCAGLVHKGLFDAGVTDPALRSFFRLLETAPMLLAAFDGADRLQFANAACRQALFIDPDETPLWSEIMRRNHAAGRGVILDTNDIDAWLATTGSRRGKIPIRCFESDYHDGRWYWAAETMDVSDWILLTAMDVSQLSPTQRELRQDRDAAVRASETDELTQISNRRHIMAQLERIVAINTYPSEVRGCACLVDLDHFKQINDRFGHTTGDEVLRAFAKLARAGVRLRDGFGRVGGEEFLFVMPGLDMIRAKGIVSRILDSLKGEALIATQPDFVVTASAGLTEIGGLDTAAAVYKRCDTALYMAKAKGRDQVQVVDAKSSTGAAPP